MATHNLLCDTLHCSNPANFFSLTESSAKEKSCDDHIKSLACKYQTVYDIAAYGFIDSLPDAAEYKKRKDRCGVANKNLQVLADFCEEEVKEALEAIDHQERKVIGSVQRHFEEVRATVRQRQATLQHEFQVLHQNLTNYLADKATELTEGAALACREIGCKARFIGLEIVDISDEIGEEIVDSWKISEVGMSATLEVLDREKRQRVTSQLWDKAMRQSKRGVIEAIKYVLDYTGDKRTSESARAQFEGVRKKLLEHTEDANRRRLTWLRQSWNLREKLRLQNRETVAIGLKLAPLQSLLCGECEDAVRKLNACVDIASQLLEELPVESVQTKIALCTVHFHCGQREKAQEVGLGLMAMEDTKQLAIEQYWTVLFYLAHSPDFRKRPEAIESVERWMGEREGDSSALPQMLRLMISALKFETLNPSVENIRLQVQSIADRNFPISIFAACNLALLALECPDDRRAIDYSELSHSIYSVIAPMSVDAAHNLCNLSARYCKVGAWNKGETYLKHAQHIYRVVASDTVYEGNLYSQMGEMHCNQKRFDQAESAYQKAKEIFAKSAASSLEAATNYERMGQMYQLQRKMEKALEHYHYAQCIYNETAPHSIEAGENLMKIGKLNEEHGSFVHAGQIYDAAAELFKSNLALDRQAEAQTSSFKVKTRASCVVS